MNALKPTKQSFSVEASGTLVPELEGAQHTQSHPHRFPSQSARPADPRRTTREKDRGEQH